MLEGQSFIDERGVVINSKNTDLVKDLPVQIKLESSFIDAITPIIANGPATTYEGGGFGNVTITNINGNIKLTTSGGYHEPKIIWGEKK